MTDADEERGQERNEKEMTLEGVGRIGQEPEEEECGPQGQPSPLDLPQRGSSAVNFLLPLSKNKQDKFSTKG